MQAEMLTSEEMLRYYLLKKMNNIIDDLNNRKIYIWGAGSGGKIILNELTNNNIDIGGFLDKKSFINNMAYDYQVLSPDDVDVRKMYVIISFMSIDTSVFQFLYNKGYREHDWCYVYEFINKEDVIYKKCKIGRYTYGYEALLKYYPLAKSIGRYCSINITARIWNNHSLDGITTSPILDYPFFYSLDKYEQRLMYQKKYGKHVDNAEFENSPIRDNKYVVIGNDVWIGANVVILPGVHIGDGAVIAAGAIVNKNVDDYAIVGGVPAKLIRYRLSEDEIREMKRIKWWNWSNEKIEKYIELFYQPKKFIDKFGGGNCG